MKLHNTASAAQALGIGRSRVRQLILQGRLPAEKYGRDWIINDADLHLVSVRPVGRPPEKS